MSKSHIKLGEVILTREARALLSGDEICQALIKHRPQNRVSTFHSQRGHDVLVITEDNRTRVMLVNQP